VQSSAQSRDCRVALSKLSTKPEDLIIADEATDLAELAWQYGVSSGDSRYCELARAFCIIADEYENYGAIPAVSISSVTREIKRVLPGIINSPNPSDAAREAAVLADSVRDRIAQT
jgi:hypothetical protein